MEEADAVRADLRTLKLQLALLRAGCRLAVEGQPRVTSSELLFRAQKEEGIDALPSVVGQLLGSLGIPSTTSKGKTRFWLEPKRLEPLVEELSGQVEIVEEEADRVIRSLGDIQSRLAPLEERFQRAQHQQQREQEVREFLQEHKPFMSQLPFLEQERLRLQEDLARLKRLKEQVQRAWVSLASLEEEIALAQAELAAVKKEINRHRSWLERLLRR